MSVTSAAPKLPPSRCLTRYRSLPRRSLTSGSIALLFDVWLEFFPKHIGDGYGRELSFFHCDQHIFPSCDNHTWIFFALHFEIQVNRAVPDLSEKRLDDQQ